MKVRIKFSVIAVLFLFINLVYIPGFDSSIYFYIRNISVPIAFFYIFYNFKQISSKHFLMNLVVTLFTLSICISSWLINDLSLRVMSYALNLWCIFFVFEIVSAKGEIKYCIKCVIWYLIIILMINDVLMFSSARNIKDTSMYFVGNKFSVTYYHMLLMAFVLTLSNRKSRKRNVLLMYPLISTVAIFVNCNTAFIGLTLYTIVICQFQQIRMKLINSKVALLTTYICSFSLILFNDFILNLEFIKYIIVNVFNRSLTLTGRIVIFQYIDEVFMMRPLFGFGYGNDMMNETLGFSNAQNALCQTAINYGVVGVILISLIIYFAFSKQKKSDVCSPIMVMIYVLIFTGSVEITFGTSFFILLAIFNGTKISRNEMII